MNIQKTLIILFTLALSLSSGFASAASLQQAKAEGFVGEQANGYVGFVSSGASAEIKEIVAEVNSKRRGVYSKLAARNKTSLSQVENVAGAKFIKKTVSGQYIQDAKGNWVKKK